MFRGPHLAHGLPVENPWINDFIVFWSMLKKWWQVPIFSICANTFSALFLTISKANIYFLITVISSCKGAWKLITYLACTHHSGNTISENGIVGINRSEDFLSTHCIGNVEGFVGRAMARGYRHDDRTPQVFERGQWPRNVISAKGLSCQLAWMHERREVSEESCHLGNLTFFLWKEKKLSWNGECLRWWFSS